MKKQRYLVLFLVVSIIMLTISSCYGNNSNKGNYEDVIQKEKQEEFQEVKQVIKIADFDRQVFAEHLPTSENQRILQRAIIKALDNPENLEDFEVWIPQDSVNSSYFSRWELYEWAESVNPVRHSTLGTSKQYSLWLAWRIQEGESWQDICDSVAKDEEKICLLLQDVDNKFYYAGKCAYKYYSYGTQSYSNTFKATESRIIRIDAYEFNSIEYRPFVVFTQ